MEQNHYILAYYISKPAQSQVTEANISSLNYNPRKNTRPEKANIFTTEYIKKYCDIDNYQPVRSKILNLTGSQSTSGRQITINIWAVITLLCRILQKILYTTMK